MRPRRAFTGLLGVVLLPGTLAAQRLDRSVVAARYESYSFDPGLPFTSVSELTIPVGVDLSLGRYVGLSISTAYARIEIDSASTSMSLNGILDTEVRLGVNIIPGRLVAIATGVVPTGLKTLEQDQAAILGALASDVIGFAAPSIGTGGSFGGGVVAAFPLGQFALGLGGTYKYALEYQPFEGDVGDLRIGPEFRGRVGLEGPLASRTYLRLAGVVAARGKDRLDGVVQNGVGHRVIGYVAVNQGFGNHQVTIYGFDVYRGSAQIEATATGAARLPKGNLIAGGTRIDLRLGQATTVTPRGEIRHSTAAPPFDPTNPNAGMRRQGTAVRFGIDLRQQLAPQFAIVVQGDGLVGDVRQPAGTAFTSFDGYRAGLFLHVTP